MTMTMTSLAWSSLVMTAYGRFDFDTAVTARDVMPIRHACGASSTAPDPLTIKSYAFEYVDFMNTRVGLNGATIQAYDASDTLRAETTTAPDGTYTLSIATGGISPRLSVRGLGAGFWQTDEFYPALLDADLAAFATDTRPFGEVPIWSGESMTSIYSSVGSTFDATTGTANVTTFDCSGMPLGDVAVTRTAPQFQRPPAPSRRTCSSSLRTCLPVRYGSRRASKATSSSRSTSS